MSTVLPDIDLRTGDAVTLDEIMRVMDEAFDPDFGEAWSRSQCQTILNLDGVWAAVAMVDRSPAGFVLARMVVDEAELLLLGVRPRFRRSGIGRRLIQHTRREAASRGASRLHLEVRDGNAAGELYQSEGFTPVGRRRDYYRSGINGKFDAITLAVALSKSSPLAKS